MASTTVDSTSSTTAVLPTTTTSVAKDVDSSVQPVSSETANTATTHTDSTQSQPVTQSLAANGDAAAISSAVGQHNIIPPTETSTVSDSIKELWSLAQQHNHKEIWGVTLTDPAAHAPTHIVLQKFLNANDGDLTRAKEQLKKTLDWRAQTRPLDQLHASFSKDKFSGLGYVTSYPPTQSATADNKEVFTWNVYGGPGLDIAKSFGDIDDFISWRATLMELAMHELDLNSATQLITPSHDPYKIYQVHDYKGTSFFRSPPQVRAAAKKTIEVLAMAYPETLKEKFFVNVPAIMGFMYGIMKVFVAAKTIKRFHPMSNGQGLVHEFADAKVDGLGQMLPREYGGQGEPLSTVGKQTRLE